MIRLVLVEDHILVREALKRLLAPIEDIEVVAETENGLELVNLLYANTFELIVMDISMPGVDSYALAHRISSNSRHPPILILSMHEELLIAKRMFKLGVKGYITKSSNADEFITAIRIVANGGKFISSKLSEYLFFDADDSSKNAKHHLLSKRELEVLKLLVTGKRVGEIAEQLSLSIKTVSTHKSSIKQKMNIKNDADLIRYAANNDIN